jgi:hypothetical protein
MNLIFSKMTFGSLCPDSYRDFVDLVSYLVTKRTKNDKKSTK